MTYNVFGGTLNLLSQSTFHVVVTAHCCLLEDRETRNLVCSHCGQVVNTNVPVA